MCGCISHQLLSSLSSPLLSLVSSRLLYLWSKTLLTFILFLLHIYIFIFLPRLLWLGGRCTCRYKHKCPVPISAYPHQSPTLNSPSLLMRVAYLTVKQRSQIIIVVWSISTMYEYSIWVQYGSPYLSFPSSSSSSSSSTSTAYINSCFGIGPSLVIIQTMLLFL